MNIFMYAPEHSTRLEIMLLDQRSHSVFPAPYIYVLFSYLVQHRLLRLWVVIHCLGRQGSEAGYQKLLANGFLSYSAASPFHSKMVLIMTKSVSSQISGSVIIHMAVTSWVTVLFWSSSMSHYVHSEVLNRSHNSERCPHIIH